MSPFTLPSLHFSPLRYRPHGVGNWSGHIPFAYDLIASLRPSLFVELGTHFGESYFAFCQAIAENSTNSKAYAVDTWEGDVHTGAYADEVFREVDEYNREHYRRFSRLMRMRFDEAAAQFECRTIDLLHIDGAHTYEAVRDDFETWWPKMRPGGIVLLHDSSVRKPEFGVWKFLDEVRQRLSVAEFLHSNGLGVVLKPGDPPDGGIVPLLFRDDLAMQQVRRYYEVCADHLEYRFSLARQEREAEWDITTQLFWRSGGEPFTDRASVHVSHTTTAEPSRVALRVPPLNASLDELRLDLTNCRAFLELHAITVLDVHGDVLSNIKSACHLSELRKRGLHGVLVESGSGVLVLDPPAGASFTVPIPLHLLRLLRSGGQVIVEMSGLEPWSFVSKMTAALTHCRCR